MLLSCVLSLNSLKVEFVLDSFWERALGNIPNPYEKEREVKWLTFNMFYMHKWVLAQLFRRTVLYKDGIRVTTPCVLSQLGLPQSAKS